MAPETRFKRESTIAYGGLHTPVESFNSTGTVTPKREEVVDRTFVSDISEDHFQGNFNLHDGLPAEDDDYASNMAEQQRRSASVSVRTSQPPPTSQCIAQPEAAAAADQGLEFVGLKVKVLVDAISQLRKFGLDHVVQLPELVLVGDQSAGKSSLMSALTEVQLPRDQGICTRCPANIKTSPAANWSCKVSLEQYYCYVHPGHRGVDTKSITKKNPFPPWKEQDLEVKEFKTITDKSELEMVIRWAQIALLNHDQDHRDFIPGVGHRAHGDLQKERESTEAKFSPNVIAIDISGPGLPALSFYDLPGIFRVAPDPKDQYLATVIENLAKKYIHKENALIIWTLAMKTDPSNSSTGKTIQECNASDRCVGVLTNPDHLHARHTEYERLLKGTAHVVRHGYFVTKQPGEESKLQGPDFHARARQEEMDFFESSSLWRNDWSQFRNSLPQITAKIEKRTLEVEAELRNCPELPESDILNVITNLLAQFSTDVKTVMNGDSIESERGEMTSFQSSSWSDLCDQFRELILHIKPKIDVSYELDYAKPDVIDLLSDDDDESMPATPQSHLKRKNNFTHQRPAQRPRLSESPSPARPAQLNPVKRENRQMEAPPTPQRRPGFRPGSFAATPFAQFAQLGKGFASIPDLQRYIADHKRPGLPGLVNDKTYNELCMQSINPWKDVLEVFMDETFQMVRTQLLDILNDKLGKYQQTALYQAAYDHLKEFLQAQEDKQRRSLISLYKLETFKLFTVNQASMSEHEPRELEAIKKVRRFNRAKAFVNKQMQQDPRKRVPSDISKEERSRLMMKKIDDVRDDQLTPEPFHKELEVAAYVRAYYITAAFRFVESVCLSMHGHLFQDIAQNIWFYLERQLGVVGANAEEKCRDLMDEDSTVRNKRERLNQEKQKLKGFSEELAKLVAQISDETMMPERSNGNLRHLERNEYEMDLDNRGDGDECYD